MKDLLFMQVETTNHCNAHCIFCPHHEFKEKGFMTDELYDKILNEAKQLPNLTEFIPMLTGEPFLDKKFIPRLRKLRETLPNVDIEIYTNGSLLTDEVIFQLKEIPNVRYSISLNGLNPGTRDAIMGLKDYWEVIRAFKTMERLGIKYRATMVGYPTISQEEMKGFVESGGTVIQYQSWAGTQYPYERRRWTSCVRAVNGMTVRYNGDVILCCFDPFGEVTFGNLNNETIEEVWKSEKHREYQMMHKQGRGNELPKCAQCTEG
jgi:radical SAM protein with 4Fe4S-binding SPASM domain